jgi:hypothetical protein
MEERSTLSDFYVYYIFGLEGGVDTLQHALAFLILRLLYLNPTALRAGLEYSELRAELQKYRKIQTESDKAIVHASLEKVALRVLNTFNSANTIWIILDRVDECQAPPTGSRSNYQRKALMKAMVHLVELTHVKVRILAVANSWRWDIKEEENDFISTNGMKISIVELTQNI